MIPTVNVAGGWETVVEGAAREELERAVLPEFLRRQRWFGGKGRRIDTLHFVDWGRFGPEASRVFALLPEVRFVDGKSDLYFLPLGISSGDKAARMQQSRQPWLIARLSGPEGEALLHDAVADDDTCMSLIEAIGARRELAMQHGRICTFPTAEFSPLVGGDGQTMPVARGPAKSSNSLIFYGRRLMLKLFRRLESGINPEFEIGRFLTERHLFSRVPRVGGAIEYHRAGSEPIMLAILQSFISNDGDGWQHALDELGRYYLRVCRSEAVGPDHPSLLELAESSPPPAVAEAIGDSLDAATQLGRRTAEMHHALSADPLNPDFAPELFTPHDIAALQDSIHAHAETALASLKDNLDQMPREVTQSARQLLKNGPDVLRHLEQGSSLHASAVKIRCHGDYHLGQVLRVKDDYVIIDFEGEPVRTVAERRAKQSPLKDVAGMLRSYHYAAYAGLFVFLQSKRGDFGRLDSWAELWSQWVSAAFLRAYLAAAAGAAFLPEQTTALTALLDAFMLEKAYYELNYELNNRPDWVRIPLRGILSLISETALLEPLERTSGWCGEPPGLSRRG